MSAQPFQIVRGNAVYVWEEVFAHLDKFVSFSMPYEKSLLHYIAISSHSRTNLLFSVSSLMMRMTEALSGDVLHLRVSNVP